MATKTTQQRKHKRQSPTQTQTSTSTATATPTSTSTATPTSSSEEPAFGYTPPSPVGKRIQRVPVPAIPIPLKIDTRAG